MKKPASRKEQARSKKTREAQENEAQNTQHAVEAQKIEPILGDETDQALVANNDIVNDVEPASSGLSAAIPGEQRRATDRPVTREAAPAKETKVHIFNFKAWFYADPVKASLTIGLAFLSWLATYTGMLELIQANTGSLDIGSRLAIGFAVMMLMLMILYLLDSLYCGGTPTWLKPVFIFGYMFLTLISVGFGFGFYWKYLEAQTEATRSAESAVSQVQVALQIGQSRMEQLQSTFTQLTTLSAQKATQEREHGNSCPNSSPGEGPRMRLRDADSQKFAFAAEYITGRATSVKKDLTALNGDLKKVVSRDASTVGKDGTRNKFLRSLGRKLDLTIARFNTLRTDPQLRQFRDSFDKRASTTVFPKGGGRSFRCPDVQLQTALRGVVRAIDDIPEIKNPKISAVEGSEAIVEAFRRLAVTLAALPTLKLPPSADELRKARKNAISAGRKVEVSNIDPGLSKRDYIPLSAAVFVDLCILLISLNRRYDNFEKLQASIAEAEAGEIGTTVLKIFEAHKNKISQEMLEIFHHAEFEHGRDYYLAVPLIKGSKKALIHERLHAKQQQTIQSQHASLDHKISILDEKQQNLTIERTEYERRKLQLTNELHKLASAEHRIIEQIKQKFLTYQGETPEQMAERHDMISLDTRRQIVLQNLNNNKGELKKHERLMHGNFQRIEETKVKIGQLKEQRTSIHKEEERVLIGQLESTAEHDLAKEARFLSNLCISLEANNILHLASIYPFQRTVRNELKKHNSRYYAEGRSYRVYRFRKVADTQSQMVLDLIMEASRRARANGDFDEQVEAQTLTGSVEKTVEEPVAVSEPEKTTNVEEIKELRELLVDFKQETASQQVELDKLRQETLQQASSPIDRGAATDLETSSVRGLSPDEERHLKKGFRSHLTGITGLGVATQNLANLEQPMPKEPVVVIAQPIPAPIHEEEAVLSGAPNKIQEKLASLFSRDRRAANPTNPTNPTNVAEPALQDIAPVIEPAAIVDPVIDTDPVVGGVTEVIAEVTPQPEIEPMVATRTDPVIKAREPKDHHGSVNEDSLLPRNMDMPEETVERPAGAELANISSAPVAPRTDEADDMRELAQRSKLKHLMKNLADDPTPTTSPVVQPTVEIVEGSADDKKAVLTDPVILEAPDDSQDSYDKFVTRRSPTQEGSAEDEPSEVENVEWGETPSMFAGESDVFDEASEELKARNLAKRFSPTTEEK